MLSDRTYEPDAPPPVAMTPESVGHYCQMNVLEHPGPKGQIWLKDVLSPLFFSQVRDVVALVLESAVHVAALIRECFT